MTKKRVRGCGLVALLTDFGTRDWYVGTLKAVLLSRFPRVRIVDITHDIPPQDTTAGAFTLAAAAPWFPAGTVFMAVVDPGVGTNRPLLAAYADGRYFVGPDNGVLSLSLRAATQRTVIQLTRRRYWLPEISQTFQARDIMAPVAAHLAGGKPLTVLGTPFKRVTPLDLPTPQRKNRHIRGCIVHIDAFGNLITNLLATSLPHTRIASSPTVRYKHRTARVVSSYATGKANELVAVVDSLGLIELAVRNGSASWMCSARRGEEVTLAL